MTERRAIYMERGLVVIDDHRLNDRAVDVLAERDGFADAYELCAWFDRTHGFPFCGHLIRWRLLPRKEWQRR